MNEEIQDTNLEQRHCCDKPIMDECHDKTRKEMLMQIKEYDFALDELNLYLDTHPDDKRALCLHNKYARILKDLERDYQRVYGPLTANYPCNKWRWIEDPWPWERGIM